MTCILALDLGMKTGWAISYGPDDIMSGTQSFKPGRFDGAGMIYLRFQDWLKEMHREHGPLNRVYFEEVRAHAATGAAHSYGGYWATLTAWCERNAVPYLGIPVQHIKKYAAGKGNASKEAVIAAVRQWGYDPRDDNEADALALLRLSLEEWVK